MHPLLFTRHRQPYNENHFYIPKLIFLVTDAYIHPMYPFRLLSRKNYKTTFPERLQEIYITSFPEGVQGIQRPLFLKDCEESIQCDVLCVEATCGVETSC